MSRLTHINEKGEAHMVDVGDKGETHRLAIAEAHITMKPDALQLIMEGSLAKGDALATARIAGIMAAKRTSDLIPLCHPLPITSVKIDISPISDTTLRIESRVKVTGQTGVEMEALTAASVAALTVYDMAKASDKAMQIDQVRLLRKEGGKSGLYEAENQ